MKKTIKLCALLLALAMIFGGCQKQEEGPAEDNPADFSYDMLDISKIVDEIYSMAELGDLTAASVEKITDKTVLTEQYYLDLDNVVAMDIRSANGKYGVAVLFRCHECRYLSDRRACGNAYAGRQYKSCRKGAYRILSSVIF